MSRKRDMPDGRWKRIMIPTPNQAKHKLSGFERDFFKGPVHWWDRGLYFVTLWDQLGRSWHFYEQFWFFRGTREWWLVYVPYFWRDGAEFFRFEERFIKKATSGRGTMSEQDFVRMAKHHKAQLQLGAIQGPLLGVLAGGGGAMAITAQTIEKINKIDNYIDMMRCGMGEKGYEEACARVVSGALMDVAKNRIK